MTKLPMFDDIPTVKVEKKRCKEKFIYCYRDGVMLFYWYKGYSDHSHYELIEYGTSRKLPKRFRSNHAVKRHISELEYYKKWKEYDFKVGLFEDFDTIAKAVE